MHVHLIACQVFFRELSFLAAGSANSLSISWLPQGLHDTPGKLTRMVQQEIDKLGEYCQNRMIKHPPQAVVLGYGLCSNGVAGLQAREIPLVVPRTDDCIGIFLGSQKRYLEAFHRYPGTYWINNGWLEHGYVPTRQALEERKARYIRDYGEENAEFLMEQDSQWQRSYTTAGYISSPLDRDGRCRKEAVETARFHGWNLVEMEEDTGMMKRMVDGPWDEEEFLVCPPGWMIEASNDERKIIARPMEGNE